MNEQVREMVSAMQEVQKTNKMVLEKLCSTTICDCDCKAKLKVLSEEVKELQTEKKQMNELLAALNKQVGILYKYQGEHDTTTGGAVGGDKHLGKHSNPHREQDSINSDRTIDDIPKLNKSMKDKTAQNAVKNTETETVKASDSSLKGILKHRPYPRSVNEKRLLKLTGNSGVDEEHIRRSREQGHRLQFTDPVDTDHLYDDTSSTERTHETSTTSKPNFLNHQNTTDIEVIHQSEKRYVLSHEFWDMTCAQEQVAGQLELKDVGGTHTVICMDISASMAEGQAWQQAKTFFHDYINGLERYKEECGIEDEHVALVTFGNKTKVLQRLTDNFKKIKLQFGNIQLGGPSPMYGGIMMSIAAAESSNAMVSMVNGIQVNTKIVIVTDGHTTDGRLCEGPDVVVPAAVEETKTKILLLMEKLHRSRMDIIIVPVGKAESDIEFLELLASVSDGKVLDCNDGHKLSRRTYLTHQANPFGLFGPINADLSPSDREQIQEITDDNLKNVQNSLAYRKYEEENQYFERPDDSLIEVGTRVRRGPDWSYPDQDGDGAGTVIGHEAKGHSVWVEWDVLKNRNVYVYGKGKYDVLIVDEPRLIPPGETIAVGCVVRPAKALIRGDVGIAERGVVIKVMARGSKLQVRWDNGKRGDYSFGENGLYEVELNSRPHSQMMDQPSASRNKNPTVAKEPVVKPNKNKNIH